MGNIRTREPDHRIYLEAQRHIIGTKDGRTTRTGWDWNETEFSVSAAASLLPSVANHRVEVSDGEAQFTLGIFTVFGGHMELMSFSEVASSLKKNRAMSLLLGNGFSMSYDVNIFSYNALYTFLSSQEDELLNKLFGVIKSKNFELIMQQLDMTIALLEAFGSDANLQEQIRSASQRLKNALLKSVKELHPEHVTRMPEEKSTACANFLRPFLESGGSIYTTNYDLLLYWVLYATRSPNPVDGFGRELENPVEAAEGEEQEWSELIWGPNKSNETSLPARCASPF